MLGRIRNFCSINCCMDWNKTEAGKKALAKAERAEIGERKQALKPKSYWLKRAQRAFNKFIRLRDKHLPCISCNAIESFEWHAGHFLPVGGCPQLRFDESNCALQCSSCNVYGGGGKASGYRENLVARIGAAEVERLETDKSRRVWTVESLQAIEEIYKAKCKELERDD